MRDLRRLLIAGGVMSVLSAVVAAFGPAWLPAWGWPLLVGAAWSIISLLLLLRGRDAALERGVTQAPLSAA
jgi:hypothetical protein